MKYLMRVPPDIAVARSQGAAGLRCPAVTSPIPSQLRDRYRPDIDGLRAIAVALVVNFHAFPEAAPGGFVGVDVFFVISGFLITGIVARELSERQFSLIRFYNRRIRRIFPALVMVLAAVLTLGWLWMLPAAYEQLGADALASAAFSANIAQLLQSGYFDVEAARKPLLHLWSLGIEEQFYLVWPPLLMLAGRCRVALLWTAVTIGLGSFALNVALVDAKPVAAFYLPFTRAWELLAGAGLALAWTRFPQSERASNWRAACGLALIAIAAAVLDMHRSFPGWWAVLPVAGGALLLSAPTAWINRVVLSWRPMVWVGLISYPLYLWHWPLLVFAAMIKFAPLTLIECQLVVGASVLLAFGTTHFIERPLRFGGQAPFKLAALGAAMAVIAASAVIVVWAKGFDVRLPPEIRAMAEVRTQVSKWRVHQCLIDLATETGYAADCVDRDRRPLVMVWGDSTAGALMPGLREAQRTRNFGLAQFTASSCIPAVNADIPGVSNCRANNDRVLALARQLKPDIVLLHGTWEKHLDHVAETVAALKQQDGLRVVVLGPVPDWRRGLPDAVLRHYLLYRRLIPRRTNEGIRPNGYEDEMRSALTPKGAEFISARAALCNAEGCLTRVGEAASDIIASDRVHLTEKGSVFLIQAIIDRLLGERGTPATDALQ